MSEQCEWNPVQNTAATVPPTTGDCQNQATVSVGREGAWHLCESCAALPEFSGFRVKRAIPSTQQRSGDSHD